MKRGFFGPWIIVPIILSVVFAVLFFPIVQNRYPTALAVLFTIIGICVIWASYFVRAYIFTRPGFTKDDT